MVSLDHPIDRDRLSAPIYQQIAGQLLRKIEQGELVPGSRIPTERQLSEAYGVNRLTVRRAIQLLDRMGLLSRRQGAGTFVKHPKIERQAARLISFTRGMQRRGFTPGAFLVRFELVEDQVFSDPELGEFSFSRVYLVHRLRKLNAEPVLLERLMIPADRFPDFHLHDLTTRSLYEVMQSEYGVQVAWGSQSLEAVAAEAYEAELLGIRVGDPLMLERRLSSDQDGNPIEYGKDLYRGDRFRFVTRMEALEV